MYQATDSLGYIAHRNAYAWGGYEVLTSQLAPEGGAVLCSEILSAAESLKAQFEGKGIRIALPASGAGAIPKNDPGAAH